MVARQQVDQQVFLLRAVDLVRVVVLLLVVVVPEQVIVFVQASQQQVVQQSQLDRGQLVRLISIDLQVVSVPIAVWPTQGLV